MSRRKTLLTLISTCAGVLALGACASATIIDEARPLLRTATSFDGQSQAQSIVNRSIEAAGGYDALNELHNVKMVFSARAARVGQAPTPDEEPTLGDPSRTVGLFKNGLVAIERFNADTLASRYVHGGLVDWIYFVGNNSVADVEPALANGIINQVRNSAHTLLALNDNSADLRVSNRVTIDGILYDGVSYADALGRVQTVYFDPITNLPAFAETLSGHPQWGDVASRISFGDYREVAGIQLSHLTSFSQGSVQTSQTQLASVELITPDDAVFEKPADATVNDPFVAPATTPRTLKIESLNDGLYYIANAAQGYNVVFADHDDGILILETPQSPQTSRDVLAAINAKFPGKSIKGAVPTHHHFDHSGGIYGYLEADVPILTTPGNVAFVKQIGSAMRNIGRNGGTPEDVSVQTFDTRMTLGAGDSEVILLNVGPNPHANEIVIAYLPAIKAVFVADIFSFRGDNLPPANANQLAFADALEILNLDIETFIPVHGGNATYEQFMDSVSRGRDALLEQD